MQPFQIEEADSTTIVEPVRAPSPRNDTVAEAEKSAFAKASEKPESESAAVGEKRSSVDSVKLRKTAPKYAKLQEKVKHIRKEKAEAEKTAVEAVKTHNLTLQQRLDQLEAKQKGELSAISPPVTSDQAAIPAKTPSSAPAVEDQPSPAKPKPKRKSKKEREEEQRQKEAAEGEKAREEGAATGNDLVALRSPTTSTISKLREQHQKSNQLHGRRNDRGNGR